MFMGTTDIKRIRQQVKTAMAEEKRGHAEARKLVDSIVATAKALSSRGIDVFVCTIPCPVMREVNTSSVKFEPVRKASPLPTELENISEADEGDESCSDENEDEGGPSKEDLKAEEEIEEHKLTYLLTKVVNELLVTELKTLRELFESKKKAGKELGGMITIGANLGAWKFTREEYYCRDNHHFSSKGYAAATQDLHEVANLFVVCGAG